MNSFAGKLLVASPYLGDRNFLKSVVLIISHDSEHAFGLLLNRRGYEKVSEVWRGLTGDFYDRAERMRAGGPLDGPVMLLHGEAELSDAQIVEGVFLSSTRQSASDVLATPSSELIPIAGYSGWGAGQLESEMEIGGWMLLPATADIVFASPDEMWKKAAERISATILSGVDLRHVPPDPRVN